MAAACTLLLAACGSSSHPTTPAVRYLDVAKVQHAIERSILEQRHLTSSVLCPPKEPEKPGKFACIATTVSPKKPHRETKTPFLVVVHAKGRVTYEGMSLPGIGPVKK